MGHGLVVTEDPMPPSTWIGLAPAKAPLAHLAVLDNGPTKKVRTSRSRSRRRRSPLCAPRLMHLTGPTPSFGMRMTCRTSVALCQSTSVKDELGAGEVSGILRPGSIGARPGNADRGSWADARDSVTPQREPRPVAGRQREGLG